jgi:hypothetical protein
MIVLHRRIASSKSRSQPQCCRACAALALPDIHTSAAKTPMLSSLNCLPTWRTVRDAMVPAIDSRCSVYVRNAAGDWTFNMELFAAYLHAPASSFFAGALIARARSPGRHCPGQGGAAPSSKR